VKSPLANQHQVVLIDHVGWLLADRESIWDLGELKGWHTNAYLCVALDEDLSRRRISPYRMGDPPGELLVSLLLNCVLHAANVHAKPM
jgi:hypothetical protein